MAPRLLSREKGEPLRLSRRRRVGPRRAPRRGARGWLGTLALLAFGVRALVPFGFEPAAGAVALVLCHQGFPAGFFRHDARRYRLGAPRAGADSHCLFCNSVSPAPASALMAISLHAPLTIARVKGRAQYLRGLSRGHTPQARAPPHVV